jgi:hypothetical protein
LPAAPIRPSDTAGGAIWERGARDGSDETVDMLDVMPCVVAAPGRAAAPWPTRSRTVRARANDPRRRGRNRVGENFVIGCNIVTLLVRVDRETEIDLRWRARGYKSRMSKCILVTSACL